jgi:hypothetical protein
MKKNKIGIVGKYPAFAVDQYGMIFYEALLPNLSYVRVHSGILGYLTITWKNNSYRQMAEPSDVVFFCIFEEESNICFDVPDVALRADAVCMLDASGFKGRVVEVIIGVCSEDGEFSSDPKWLKKVKVRN